MSIIVPFPGELIGMNIFISLLSEWAQKSDGELETVLVDSGLPGAGVCHNPYVEPTHSRDKFHQVLSSYYPD